MFAICCWLLVAVAVLRVAKTTEKSWCSILYRLFAWYRFIMYIKYMIIIIDWYWWWGFFLSHFLFARESLCGLASVLFCFSVRGRKKEGKKLLQTSASFLQSSLTAWMCLNVCKFFAQQPWNIGFSWKETRTFVPNPNRWFSVWLPNADIKCP